MPPGGRRLCVAVPLVVVALVAAPGAARAEQRPDPYVKPDARLARVTDALDRAGALTGFWADYTAGADLRRSAAVLDAYLRAEGSPAEPVRGAARMLVAHANGDDRRAWCERLALAGARIPAEYGRFVGAALAASDRALGISRPTRATTAPDAYAGNGPDRMADDDVDTFYWSSTAPRPGSAYVLDLGRVRPLDSVAVSMGTAARPLDYLRSGVLEGSVDGVRWQTVRTLPGSASVSAALDARPVRYLRLRATAGQRHWLAVREFSVRPAPADAWADGDPETGHRAADPTVALGAPRPVDRVRVLAAAGTPLGALVQLRDVSGTWRTVGRLGGEYTDVGTRGMVADRVRVLFPDSTSGEVREIVVRPAE
ncbi:discoidin domain-containing protein [Actinokineospora enzanensis]|uniref:discoidin domain-containing protein n=1 Tax=Actinokineospora enzanensis TaxID=155975 RepID=UPI0012ECA3E3|nr:discoidin domain-containing protein [Actinokineospora enzanensis]